MKVANLHSVFFLGVGGIGMSALARWFCAQGKQVYGYDKTQTRLTDELEKEGIIIHFEDSVENIAQDLKNQALENVLVVYTPAIPSNNAELSFFQDSGYTLKKRAEVLGLICSDYYTVAVAGTHGKTTTSSMVAHLLKHAGKDIVAFLGGLTVNYESNMILNETIDAIAVVEADEFDRSFLQLSPDLAIVTSTDADHLDIYGDKDQLKDSFREFVGKLRDEGKLFAQDKIANDFENSKIKARTYGSEKSNLAVSNIEPGMPFKFDVHYGEHSISGLKLFVPGYHNVQNASAAVGVALELGIGEEAIRLGLESYRGVKRRFEYIINSQELVYVDDYAHHPEEINAFLNSIRKMYPGKKITAIFQPHLFSRTQDFSKEFAASLDLADEVYLLEIYPARELPIAGVNAELILNQMTIEHREVISKEEVIKRVGRDTVEVLATMGAGDIDQIVEPLKKALL